MFDKIDIEVLGRQILEIPQERDSKGWSYSFVYYLRDIKDIFLIYRSNLSIKTIPELLKYCKDNDIHSESGKSWTNRGLLEIVNALVNFGFLTVDKQPLDIRFTSGIGQELLPEDKIIFIGVFNTYFRFRQYRPLFSEEIGVTLAYMENKRFFNRFINPTTLTLYEIEGDLPTRYWDVFTKWGTALGLLNKCRIEGFDINLGELESLGVTWVQLTRPMPTEFSVIKFMEDNMADKCVYIPHLIYKLLVNLAYPIEQIKEKIITECSARADEYRLQTITEIFILPSEKSLFPLVNDNYKSHILKLT